MKSEYSPLIDIMEEKCRARAAGLDASFSFHPKETGTGVPAEDAAAVFCARGYTATIFFDTVTAGVYNVLECRIKLDCTGVIMNIGLGMKIWDYSKRPFNILGQICLLYSFFWFLLSFPAISICNFLREKVFDKM